MAFEDRGFPLPSRITLACDAYHAMTSDRPYRAALDPAQDVTQLRSGAGTQFDPSVVDVLLEEIEESAGQHPPPAAGTLETAGLHSNVLDGPLPS